MIGDYLKTLLKVLAVGAGFASIPLIAAFADLQPPWPPAIGHVSAAFLLLSSVLAWEWTRASKQSHRRTWIVAAVILTTVGLFGYLILYSQFVDDVPGSTVRVIRGFRCTQEAIVVYGDRCPELDREALRGAEWETSVLWTRSSITIVRLALTMSWILFTAGLVCAVGAVIAGRTFTKPRSATRITAADQRSHPS